MLQYFIIILFALFFLSLFYFKKFWTILFQAAMKCWFPILTNLLAIMFLVGTAQGKDIIREVDFFKSGIRSFTSLFFLWMWAYNNMKLASTMLDLDKNYKLQGKIHEVSSDAFSLIISGLLGVIPFISAITVLATIQDPIDPIILTMLIIETWFFVIFLMIRANRPICLGSLTISIRVLHLLSLYVFKLYLFIRKIINRSYDIILNRKGGRSGRTRGISSVIKRHMQEYEHGLQFLNWIVHFLLYISIAIWPIFFAEVFGSIGLFFIALSFFCIVAMAFAYFRARTKVPLFPFLFLAYLVFSMVNDNNKSGTVLSETVDKRQELDQHFENWFCERAAQDDTVRITLVAAEGGGLRSAYWTYGVLRQLHLDIEGFYDQLYAISSVSGGGVGSALYCTEQFTGLSGDVTEAPIINDDNLTPMLGSLIYRELIQSIIPLGLEKLDRSRTMDRTFEHNWEKKYPDQPLWSNRLHDLWLRNESLPLLFFNTTKVETGEAVLFSTVSFDSTQIHAHDMMNVLQEQPLLSEVVGLSARFMFLQPAGRYDFVNGKVWGRLVDGGYYDNSGLLTIFQLYIQLKKQVNSLINKGVAKGATFNIIYLNNVKHDEDDPNSSFLVELNSPIKTLLNSWSSRTTSFDKIIISTLPGIDPDDQFFKIQLNREELPLPLGWYFSERSRNEMIRQIHHLHENQNYLQVTRSYSE